MSDKHRHFVHHLDKSAIFTFVGIVLLFSAAVIVTLIAPSYIDPTWTEPTSSYQVQMYEIADPHVYISNPSIGGYDLQFVHHLKKDFSLLAFRESDTFRIVAPPELEKFVTHFDETPLKLSSQLLLLRNPKEENGFNAVEAAQKKQTELKQKWELDHPDWKEKGLLYPNFIIMELYAPSSEEAFAYIPGDGVVEDWIDENYKILDESVKQKFHQNPGVLYVTNPREYRIKYYKLSNAEGWRYDPTGQPIKDLQQLTSPPLGFHSRKDLISLGEHIYAIEGCWYCHTDQTRTLIQDVVVNGSDSYPAPPSSANEYIYQQITFPGTKRNGPDLSRVGVKRPSRDWHKAHFWSPKTASQGSIMPAFQHFFDFDPRGTAKTKVGIPNIQFEAVFQYLMTKGTRITPPTQAWWLGKDPLQTIDIIENRKKVR
jgi:cytochrome c oxidase cbb3-type subunit II